MADLNMNCDCDVTIHDATETLHSRTAIDLAIATTRK